jgi:hypothetical protein
MIWSRSASGIERHFLMRLESEAVCIRIHMIKNEATIIHLQKTFFMLVDVLSEVQIFGRQRFICPK